METFVWLGVDDAGEVLTLQRAAYVTEARDHDDLDLPPLRQSLADLEAELADPQVLAAGWRNGTGRLLAAVRVRIAAGDPVVAHVSRLAVVPDWQGRRLGSRLLAEIETHLPAEASQLRLFTGEYSHANLRLYARHGYLESHREPTGAGYALVHLHKPAPRRALPERTAMSRLLTLLPVLDQETDRLLATVRGFGDDDVRRPSLLPGWTRGHLLTHIARSGDVLRGLAEGVVSGVPATGYASDEARNAAINAGADRPAPELAADVAASAAAFRTALLAVPDTAAGERLHLRPGVQFPVHDLPVIRLVEVVLHHTDLDAGYTGQDWTPDFTALELSEPQATWRAERQAATR